MPTHFNTDSERAYNYSEDHPCRLPIRYTVELRKELPTDRVSPAGEAPPRSEN